jgi:hypothetical protein
MASDRGKPWHVAVWLPAIAPEPATHGVERGQDGLLAAFVELVGVWLAEIALGVVAGEVWTSRARSCRADAVSKTYREVLSVL